MNDGIVCNAVLRDNDNGRPGRPTGQIHSTGMKFVKKTKLLATVCISALLVTVAAAALYVAIYANSPEFWRMVSFTSATAFATSPA